MLDRDYATKLIKKHRIDRWQFEEIQNTIDKGICILEPPNKVLFLYVKDKIRPVIYTLIVKTDYTRNALWLVTFHRIKKEQFTKRLRPDQIIRSHVEDD